MTEEQILYLLISKSPMFALQNGQPVLNFTNILYILNSQAAKAQSQHDFAGLA